MVVQEAGPLLEYTLGRVMIRAVGKDPGPAIWDKSGQASGAPAAPVERKAPSLPGCLDYRPDLPADDPMAGATFL